MLDYPVIRQHEKKQKKTVEENYAWNVSKCKYETYQMRKKGGLLTTEKRRWALRRIRISPGNGRVL